MPPQYPSQDSQMEESSGSEGRFAAANGNPRTRPNCVRCRNHNIKTPLKGHKRYCDYRNCRCHKCLNTQERQKMMAEQIAQRRRNVQDEERRTQGLPIPVETPSPEPEDPDTPTSGFNSSNSSATNYPISTISNNSNSNLSLVSSSTNVSVINRPSSTPSTNTNSNANTNTTVMILNSKSSDQQTSAVPLTTNRPNDSPNLISDNSISARNNETNATATNNNINICNKSKEPVRIDSIIYLKDLLRYQIDINALLYVILKEVNSDVKEAYRRIIEGQEEMRPLRALLTTPTDYAPQLPCNPLRLPLPLLPSLHQYRFHPYFKTAATVSPPYSYQIPRPGDMFQCECIPKPDLHDDKTYSRSLEV